MTPLDDALRAESADEISIRRINPAFQVGVIVVTFLACATAHYSTPYTTPAHSWHSVHYLVFFIPIVLAGLWFGWGAGLGMAILAGLAYAPYSFRHVNFQTMAGLTQTLLEMGLYLMVGATMGWVADRERKGRRRLEAANAALRARSAQLVAAEHQLAQAERLSALGRLAATIAHEVRNPLGSIKGSVEILRDDFPEGHTKHRFLGILVNETNRLDGVLDNFLEFARPPALTLTHVSPAAVVQHVAELVAPQCRSDGITLDVHCRAQVGPVTADERQLQQALLNVVLNAVEAMPTGGTLTLRCGTAPAGDASAVRIVVEDTGSGLSAEQLVNAFEPFYSSKPTGTGLGLTTVRKIIEAHGGGIAVANRADGHAGTRVTLSIPVRDDAALAPAEQEANHVAG